jgi:DNA-cytosine methyltransferase
MPDLLSLLSNAVAESSRHRNVALLLSGGLDSLSVGLALQAAGKAVHAYTFCIEGLESQDLRKAIALANHFGWHLTVVRVPVGQVADDFVRLAIEHGCRRKVQFEVTFPLLYVLQQIDEGEVFTGWNADEHYGNDRQTMLEQARLVRDGASPAELKEAFDRRRRNFFEVEMANPQSGDTWLYASRLAEQHRKRLVDPYLDRAVFEYLLQFDHEQLSPLTKPLIRKMLGPRIIGLLRGSIAVGIQMQKGGGVDVLFERLLLPDDRINRFKPHYVAIAPLCERWGAEVARDPERYRKELLALKPLPKPSCYDCKPGRYQPYTMAQVQASAARRRFTAISLFAGGGGSCLGLCLAGGHVILSNEFVREAARTYKTNFPGAVVDARDIREIGRSKEEVIAFLAEAGAKPREVDLIVASPPCCEYSTGKRSRIDSGALRRYSDTQQRNMDTLIFDVIAVLHHAKPKVVVIENIPAMKNRFPELFETALDALRFASGPRKRLYYAHAAVLSAADFGTPQNRRRLFFIAVRNDVADAVGIRCDEDVLRVFPGPTHAPISVRSALAGIHQTEADLRPWRRSMLVHRVGRVARQLPHAPKKVTRPLHVGMRKDRWFSLARCAWDRPAPTLTVTGQGPGGLSGALHPEDDRKFSLPELKRLTGLPDDFALTGTLVQAAERIGRMVPPPLMRVIAEAIYQRVLLPHRARRS